MKYLVVEQWVRTIPKPTPEDKQKSWDKAMRAMARNVVAVMGCIAHSPINQEYLIPLI